VVLVSGLGELGGIARGIDLGAEDYLTKPYNAVMLRARVDASLEKKRLRDRERRHLDAIERERRRYDELLHSILPDRVIAELRTGREFRPFRKDDVAVLFADLVGFTAYCGRHGPEEVVSYLQRLVEAWDGIAAGHGVEKIKTVGDGFMAACNLLEPARDPVGGCVACGRAMIAAARGLGPGLDVRVGVHVGPVVAGLLGRRQFLFDIWGDTVNTASRVESHGLAGRVNLSAEAYGRVADRYPGAARWTAEVKGKDLMDLYAIA
jgi:class 3 adenylate cyclase